MRNKNTGSLYSPLSTQPTTSKITRNQFSRYDQPCSTQQDIFLTPLAVRTIGSNKQLDEVRIINLKMSVERQKVSLGKVRSKNEDKKIPRFRNRKTMMNSSKIDPIQYLNRSLQKMFQTKADEDRVISNPEIKQLGRQTYAIPSNQIQTYKSSCLQSHNPLKSFGVATYRGYTQVNNSHYIRMQLGSMKTILLTEGYDGEEAALFVHNQYLKHQMNYWIAGKETDEEDEKIAEQTIGSSYYSVAAALKQKQVREKDNSGCSLLTVTVINNTIFLSNCGNSQALATPLHQKKLSFLCERHNTSNKEQMVRVAKGGGKFYQTTVSIFHHFNVEVKGPKRMHPSGLTLTRTIGKSFISAQSNQRKHLILNEPEITRINVNEIKYLLIVSSTVADNMSSERMADIVDCEIGRREEVLNTSRVAEQCAKRIVHEVASLGIRQSVSVVVLIFNYSQELQGGRGTSKLFMLMRNEDKSSSFNKKISQQENSSRFQWGEGIRE